MDGGEIAACAPSLHQNCPWASCSCTIHLKHWPKAASLMWKASLICFERGTCWLLSSVPCLKERRKQVTLAGMLVQDEGFGLIFKFMVEYELLQEMVSLDEERVSLKSRDLFLPCKK